MHLNQEMVDELNVLVKFKLDTVQAGIKIHHTAAEQTRDAAQRLYDKGFITQPDGGYLTELGRELTEYAQNALNLLTSARCL